MVRKIFPLSVGTMFAYLGLGGLLKLKSTRHGTAMLSLEFLLDPAEHSVLYMMRRAMC